MQYCSLTRGARLLGDVSGQCVGPRQQLQRGKTAVHAIQLKEFGMATLCECRGGDSRLWAKAISTKGCVAKATATKVPNIFILVQSAPEKFQFPVEVKFQLEEMEP